MFSCEDSHETILSCQDGDSDVSDIFLDMLTKSQVHKKNGDNVHEDVAADDSGINNHDHALEDMQTLGEGLISKNESILLVYATKSKKYKLTTSKDRSAHIEDNVDMEQIATVKSRNYMIFTNEYGSIHDPLFLLETIRLSPRLSGFLRFKLYQMDVHNVSLNR